MITRKSIFHILYIVLIAALLSRITAADSANPPLGTGFTYQGRLTDGSAPANGLYDFEFRLFDESTGGSQVGNTLTHNSVNVTEGLFTVVLDFGTAFSGSARYLEISVRPGASGDPYTTLDPRQALTAAPHALYASTAPWAGLADVPAGFADGVDDGATYTAGSGLDLTGTEFSVTGAPWAGLTGVPAGFADGTDNDTTYTAGDGLQLVGTQFSGSGSAYDNVVIVAQSGGDFTSIQAALDSIVDASASNRYLVYVAPGVYAESVIMESYVDIQGSGELTTKITQPGTTSIFGTVWGVDDAELRFLTVENTGGSTYAIALYNSGSPRLTHISLTASGGTYNYGMYNSWVSPLLLNVTATVSGGAASYGLYNSQSYPTITNSFISASGGSNNYGLYNTATLGTNTIQINYSQISGSTYTIRNDSEYVVRIGASRLSGGPISLNGGTATCVSVYDENYASPGYTTCP